MASSSTQRVMPAADMAEPSGEDVVTLSDEPVSTINPAFAVAPGQNNSADMFSDGQTPPECTTVPTSIPNRFRFIKVDRSYVRGRWKCDDYADSEQPPSRAASDISTISSGNESEIVFATLYDMTNQVACSLDGTLFESSAPPDLSGGKETRSLTSPVFCSCYSNPIPSDMSINTHSISVAQLKKVLSSGDRLMALHQTDEQENNLLENSLISAAAQADVLASGNKDETMYPSEEEIDSKIEAAMDLVKSHLTNAVREEVSELKQRIKSLQETNWLMMKEINMLRQHVPPEVLATLQSYLPAAAAVNNCSPTPCGSKESTVT